jgi:hypothetical protein
MKLNETGLEREAPWELAYYGDAFSCIKKERKKKEEKRQGGHTLRN